MGMDLYNSLLAAKLADGGDFSPSSAQLAAMNSGITSDRLATDENNIAVKANGYKIDTGAANTTAKTFNLSDIPNGIYLIMVTNSVSQSDKYGVSVYCVRKTATDIAMFTEVKAVENATILSITASDGVATITYGRQGYHVCTFLTVV